MSSRISITFPADIGRESKLYNDITPGTSTRRLMKQPGVQYAWCLMAERERRK